MRGRFFVAGLVLLVAYGCGGETGPETHPVTGTVTLDGEPVEGATVSFSPAEGGVRAAVGETDATGRYTLTTMRSGDGAMAGSFNVRVFKYEVEEGTVATGPPPTEDQEYTDDYAGAAREATPPPENLLPDRYADARGSGLSYTVVPGENTYDIELTR